MFPNGKISFFFFFGEKELSLLIVVSCSIAQFQSLLVPPQLGLQMFLFKASFCLLINAFNNISCLRLKRSSEA